MNANSGIRIEWLKQVVGTMVGVVFLSGCGQSLEDVREEHGKGAKAQLERLETVLDHCRELDPIKEDSVPEVEGVLFAEYHERPNGNARTLWLDAYDGKEDYAEPIQSYTSQSDWWYQTMKAFQDDPPEFSEKKLEELGKEFEFLRETEYVLVLKTSEYSTPKVSDNPPYKSDKAFYEMGAMSGEAHLYRLADGEHLGAVQFLAYGEVIGVGFMDFALSSDDPEKNVDSLKRRLFGSIHDFAQATLAKRAEGVDSVFELIEVPFVSDRLERRSVEKMEEAGE